MYTPLVKNLFIALFYVKSLIMKQVGVFATDIMILTSFVYHRLIGVNGILRIYIFFLPGTVFLY